ncbi:CLC_0170 family protein [Paenibacillus sp. P22]|uniref:CLC_0170 family protein n=1 Tax=Paenibacillus sp. P22 TaxID=483908 RepID=UPI000433518D|nr:CLC_0170 family protein [Paenibacillus sp. P22]CDN44134.1 hypothetical protein BN871_EF_00170 [Paenibacillus sp. P22]
MLDYNYSLVVFVILSLLCGLFMLTADLRMYEWLGKKKEGGWTKGLAWIQLGFAAAGAAVLALYRLLL